MLFSLLIALIVVCQAPAQDEVNALLDKAAKAHGGKAKLARMRGFRLTSKGSIDLMGLPANYTQESTVDFSGKIKETVDANANGIALRVITIYDGTQGWVVANGKTKVMSKESLDDMREFAYVQTLIARIPVGEDKKLHFTYLGESQVNGRTTIGIKVSSKGHKDVCFYFDKERSLITKTDRRTKNAKGQECTQETLVLDFQDVDGIKFNKRVVVNQDGQKQMEFEISSVKFFDKPMGNDVFAKPD
jgi:hypothetical protein